MALTAIDQGTPIQTGNLHGGLFSCSNALNERANGGASARSLQFRLRRRPSHGAIGFAGHVKRWGGANQPMAYRRGVPFRGSRLGH